jgi:hypothetical protein
MATKVFKNNSHFLSLKKEHENVVMNLAYVILRQWVPTPDQGRVIVLGLASQQLFIILEDETY